MNKIKHIHLYFLMVGIGLGFIIIFLIMFYYALFTNPLELKIIASMNTIQEFWFEFVGLHILLIYGIYVSKILIKEV